MAKITLKNLGHSYIENPENEADWALKKLNLDWQDGHAYALLGPSGCGKTTLLNIISGLLEPTHGDIIFDDTVVTHTPTDQRNIAQIFQFPVVYDTMTVYDNLAFPLRNRGQDEVIVDQRVLEIADLVELTDMLHVRVSKLTAGDKQKISLGRGLVRTHVNAILFDEPLTVIDPHLKWQLRSKLKKLQQLLKTTMIYVTHDQTEALTFADQVVVLKDGAILQTGTPVELFEKPQHTFVGHFIGSPGMNILPCTLVEQQAYLKGYLVETVNSAGDSCANKKIEIGIRPEFVRFADTGLPVVIHKVSDAGHIKIVETLFEGNKIKLIVPEKYPLPTKNAYLHFDENKTFLYANDQLV